MKIQSVTDYITACSEPSRPIVIFLRDLIHEVYPEIEEDIKWNAPSFQVNGKIAFNIMAFKKHVNLMFHAGKFLKDTDKITVDFGEKSDMTGLKQITNIEDLPDLKKLRKYMKQAIKYYQ